MRTSSFKPQAALVLVALALLLIILTGMVGTNQGVPRQRANDTYVEAMVGAPHFVNPLLAVSDTDTDLSHLIFSGLTRVDASGNIVPDLASSYEVSPDSAIYTFTIKPDLHWQDGEVLTADDVYFTLSTLLQSPDFPGDPSLAQPWKGVDIKLLSAQSLRFALPAPDASFPQYTTLGILPRHIWGNTKPAELTASPYNQSPIGSGPWRCPHAGTAMVSSMENVPVTPVAGTVSSVDGVLLERNPYLPSPPSDAGIAHLWLRLYPTFGAALTGFEMGEVHGLGHIPAERMSEVARLPGVTLHKQTLARYNMLLLNVQSPIFDKVETRRAFELAINRNALSDDKEGSSSPAANPIPVHSWAYDPTVQAKAYNPAEAGKLLDTAGWTLTPSGLRARNGITLTVVLAANVDIPANATAARRAVNDLRAVGVDAQLALVNRDALLHDYLGPRAFHIVLAGWEASGADPDVYKYWHSSQAITGGLNFAGWENSAADKALQDGHTNPDHEARKKAYADFQRIFADDVPAIVLFTPMYVYATHAPAHDVSLPNTDMLSGASRFDTIQDWQLQAP